MPGRRGNHAGSRRSPLPASRAPPAAPPPPTPAPSPQAILERAVVHTRRLGGARNFPDRLRELLYALRHRRLIARDFLGALRRLERHRTVLLSPRPAVRPSGGPTVRIPAPLLGEIPRPVAQLALRRRHRISRARDGTRRLARLSAQLFHAGQPQRDLGAAPAVRGGCVIERFDIQPQRVAGQETALLSIEPPLDDRSIPDSADLERGPHRLD